MDVIRKDATITNTDDGFPGSFLVALSVPTRDRDGDTLRPEEWKQPLPEHITFDADHGMSVASTVGSGRPFIDVDGTHGAGKGALIVEGRYSSLPRAQEVRTLVKEGHINRTSVAFMTEKTQKDGATVSVRELLNGAFVAIPSNREAVILASKAFTKTGARNSKSDAEHIQAIYDHAVALGATSGGDTDSDEDVAASKSATVKQVADLLATLDQSHLPVQVRDAIALVTASAADEPHTKGVEPDEDAEAAAVPVPAPAAGTPAPGAATETAPVEDDESIQKQLNAARQRFYATLSGRN